MLNEIKLLKINGVELPNPLKGSFKLKKTNKFNSYDCEDGSKRIEPIRENILTGSASYKGLFETDVARITAAASLVSTLELYSPFDDAVITITALISDIDSSNIITKEAANAWSLSFNFEEINR